MSRAKSRKWVVYAKRPFAGPQQVLDYVGRYTHRVAISNNRLRDIENHQVDFQWKDYRHSAELKTMTLPADEFIRRFLLHVLPDGFQRIRYYGFLGNRYRQQKLKQCRRLLSMAVPAGQTNAVPTEKTIGIATKRLPAVPCTNAPNAGKGACWWLRSYRGRSVKSAPRIDSS